MASSADQIKVDYDNLSQLEAKLTSSLDVIGKEFESSVVLAAYVGDTRLAGKVVSFGQSWNKHRFDIRDNLTFLRDSVTNIRTQLEAVDEQLAAGLSGAGSSGSSTGPGPRAV